MPTIIIGKPGTKGIAIGPGAMAVGAGGVIIEGDFSGNIEVTGDHNRMTIPPEMDDNNLVITGSNNQIIRGKRRSR